jgi:hypothetical protein
MIICDDDELYAVKFAQNEYGDGRAIFTEQLVARLGRRIGAPVPAVCLVDVGPELTEEIRAKPELQLNFLPQPGLHHGSKWELGYSDRQGVAYVDENRERFAALHVLYAWFLASDQQWIYRNEAPHLVLSVDHSGFLPGGPNWTAETVAAEAAAIVADPTLAGIGLTVEEHNAALAQLATVSDGEIEEAVGATPDEWGTSPPEREAVASYLIARRDAIPAVLGG